MKREIAPYGELWSLLLFARSLHSKFSPIRDGFTSRSACVADKIIHLSVCRCFASLLGVRGKVCEPAGKKKDRSCRGMKEGTGLRQARCKGRRDEKGKSKSKGHTRSVHCKIGACGTRNLRYRRAMQSCLEPLCSFPPDPSSFSPPPPLSRPFSASSFFGFLFYEGRGPRSSLSGAHLPCDRRPIVSQA